jgi:ADP-ribosyl-[dinitrogen reductase] hydrolase
MESLVEKFKGCILGLACGDALGGPLEFMSPQAIRSKYGRVVDMIGGGWLKLAPGEYTDDTQMTICIIDSIVDNDGVVSPEDVARRFLQWYKTKPKDVGSMTSLSISYLADGTQWHEAGRLAWQVLQSAGNGGLMRSAPIGLLHYRNTHQLVLDSRRVCSITHYDPRCQESCAALNLAIAALTQNRQFSLNMNAVKLSPEVDRAVNATAPPTKNSGFTLDTLTTAFWALRSFDDFEEALISVINLGGDTDTSGAVTGALMGAKGGLSAIPKRWLNTLQNRDRLENLATQLYTLATKHTATVTSDKSR